jgi:hypothetical protein
MPFGVLKTTEKREPVPSLPKPDPLPLHPTPIVPLSIADIGARLLALRTTKKTLTSQSPNYWPITDEINNLKETLFDLKQADRDQKNDLRDLEFEKRHKETMEIQTLLIQRMEQLCVRLKAIEDRIEFPASK